MNEIGKALKLTKIPGFVPRNAEMRRLSAEARHRLAFSSSCVRAILVVNTIHCRQWYNEEVALTAMSPHMSGATEFDGKAWTRDF